MGTGMALPINHQRHARIRSMTNEYARKGFAKVTMNVTYRIPHGETGHISKPRLSALLRVHLAPINLIVYKESHNDS